MLVAKKPLVAKQPGARACRIDCLYVCVELLPGSLMYDGWEHLLKNRSGICCISLYSVNRVDQVIPPASR
jgi:hypothetical protein